MADLMDDEVYQGIINNYVDSESVKEAAARSGVSVVKARRVLITEGLWSSRTSEEIGRLQSEGRTVAEIAEILSITEKAVQQYLPYRRGIYMGRNRSVAALNSEDYRKRIEEIKKRVLHKNEMKVDSGRYPMEFMMNKEKRMSNEKKEAVMFEQFPGIVTFRELPENTLKMVMGRGKMRGEDIYRLHLEIVRDLYEGFTGKEGLEYTDILKRHGGVKYGNTISRDILVPGSLPLYSLHYVIQRLFGWQNSHLHRFQLPMQRMKELCDDNLAKYATLIGILYRSPYMPEGEEFWTDDYEGGSFKTWLRKKYSGYQMSLCHGESYFRCREDMEQNLDTLMEYAVSVSAGRAADEKRMERVPEEISDHYGKIAEAFNEHGVKAAFEIMNMDDLYLFDSERGGDLLERLRVEEVLCFGNRRLLEYEGEEDTDLYSEPYPMSFSEFMNEDMLDEIDEVEDGDDSPDNQPVVENVTKELIYNYDFGDGWKVRISGSMGCADLIEAGRLTQEELDDAIVQVHTSYRPVVIAQDGLSVFDDVGGMSGYCEFLKGTYEEGEYDGPYDYGDSKANLEWARRLGWSRRRSSNRSFL